MWSLYWSVLWFCGWSPLIIKKETPSQMIPCQFCKIFKNTFFIEHLRWLLLAILKPLDSQRQLCKWISKLVTIYFISTFCWCFCLDGPAVGDIWRFWFFRWPHNWSVTWHFGWGPLILNQHPTSFGDNGPCKCGDKTFWLDTWPHDRCFTWLCGWGPLILSHHPAKFGVHRPSESGNTTLFICHVTTILKCHVIYGRSPLILSYQLAKFGVHSLCETRDITFWICLVTTWLMCHVALWVGSPHPKSTPC